MEFTNQKDISDFIASHLEELGGDAYGVDYIAEKIWDWAKNDVVSIDTPAGKMNFSFSEWQKEQNFNGNR